MVDGATNMEKTTDDKITFIQSLPLDMTPRDVVEAGARAGYEFSRSYVYYARKRPAIAAEAAEPQPPAKAARGAKKPGKKGRRRPGTKREFILGHPELSAREVVTAAKKKGIKLMTHSVYTVRSQAKRAGEAVAKTTTKRVAKAPKKRTRALPKAKQVENGSASSGQITIAREHAGTTQAIVKGASRNEVEAIFTRAVALIGVLRGEELLEEIRAKLG